jgi:hypothetical protein
MLDLQRLTKLDFKHALAADGSQYSSVRVPGLECADLSAYGRKERLAAFDP